MVKASMFGLEIDSIKANGNIIECMARAKLFGLMGAAIKVSISMIRNMALERSNGLMEESILDIGKMASNMVEENITYKMERRRQGSGFKEKRLNGFRKQRIERIEIDSFLFVINNMITNIEKKQ